jgi:hypothetical protein
MNLLRLSSLVAPLHPAQGRASSAARPHFLLGIAALCLSSLTPGCADAARGAVPDAGGWVNSGDGDGDSPSYGDGDGDSPSYGDGDSPSYGDGDGDGDYNTSDSGAPGPMGGDIGSILCGLVGGCPDGGPLPPAPHDGGVVSNDPNDTIVPGREPDPNNLKECPKHAPENPIGSCIGVPIYGTCSYTTYHCICDWIHWICI